MPLYRGWRVALAGAGVNFFVGVNYIWSIFATGLVDQKGWTHPQAALPYSIFLLSYALSMVFAGRAQDYFGPRPVITLGSFLTGGSFIACSLFLDYPFTAAVLWGALLGMGTACCFGSTTPAAIKWFTPEKKGLVTGLIVFSTGIAALVMSPLAQLLIRQSTAEAFLISGIALVAGIFLLAHLIENPPLRIGDLRGQLVSKGRFAALTDSRLYYFWVMFFLTTSTGYTVAAHLDNIMRVQAGFGKGYLVVALFACGNALGRIVGGLLSDRIGRLRAMTVIFAAMALVLIGMMFTRNPLLLTVQISVLALTFGSLFTIFPAAVAHFFGESNFGLNYGLVFTGLGAAGLFPYLGGTLFEIQQHYISTFALLLGTSLLACTLSIIVRHRVGKE